MKIVAATLATLLSILATPVFDFADPVTQPAATGNPTAAPISESDRLNQEARDFGIAKFSEHWSKYGDFRLSYYRFEGKNFTQEFVEEWKGAVAHVSTDTLSEADRLNGLTWRGLVSIQPEALRRYGFGDAPAAGAAFTRAGDLNDYKNGWSDWRSLTEVDVRPWRYAVEKRGEQWSASADEFSNYYRTVPCDESGIAAFDPESLPRSQFKVTDLGNKCLLVQCTIVPSDWSHEIHFDNGWTWWQWRKSDGDLECTVDGQSIHWPADLSNWVVANPFGNDKDLVITHPLNLRVRGKNNKPVAFNLKLYYRPLAQQEKEQELKDCGGLLPLPSGIDTMPKQSDSERGIEQGGTTLTPPVPAPKQNDGAPAVDQQAKAPVPSTPAPSKNDSAPDWKRVKVKFDELVQKTPDNPILLNNYAWFLLNCKDQSMQDPALALKYALKANELTRDQNPLNMDTLALAMFRTNDIPAATGTVKAALALLSANPSAEKYRARLEAHLKMFTEAAQTSANSRR
jgi:hypothetical protein